MLKNEFKKKFETEHNIHLSKSDNWLKLCYVIIGNPAIPLFGSMVAQADVFKQPLTVATFGTSLKKNVSIVCGSGLKVAREKSSNM